jgi:hypothetical protein
MSGEIVRHHPGNWRSRTFAVGDRVRLKQDTLLGVITDVERSARPRGNGWLCAYCVQWDSAFAGMTERCHPAQLIPASAPLAEDDDDQDSAP